MNNENPGNDADMNERPENGANLGKRSQDAAGRPENAYQPSSTPPMPATPPSPYSAPQGAGGSVSGQSQPGWYHGSPSQAQPQPGYPQSPPTGYPQHQPQPGYAPRPRDMTVAYTWAYFLGMFGAHKFYMGQNLQGGIYLGLTMASLLLSFLGIGFLLTLFMLFLIYGDLRTMPEQVARSNNGERFNDLFEFLKKAFRS